MANVDVSKFNQQMCKLLNLPAGTVWFELRCAVDEYPTVKCAYLVPANLNDAAETEMQECIAKFTLTPKENG
ncbi:MAG: hypothetical protein WC426_02565 [Sulfuriferula sp.]